MTRFNIEQITEQDDTIYVEIDHRFNVALVRTDTGLDLRVYPVTNGKIWDYPYITFTADESEFAELEAELLASPEEGDGQ
ncbi:MAG TPA: hypothetical protein VGN12_28070 [Pirellulales bacterium]|jgi:hypothetical protein